MDTRMEAMLQGGPFKKLLEEQIAELRQKYDMKKAELEILYFLSKCGSLFSDQVLRHLQCGR